MSVQNGSNDAMATPGRSDEEDEFRRICNLNLYQPRRVRFSCRINQELTISNKISAFTFASFAWENSRGLGNLGFFRLDSIVAGPHPYIDSSKKMGLGQFTGQGGQLLLA